MKWLPLLLLITITSEVLQVESDLIGMYITFKDIEVYTVDTPMRLKLKEIKKGDTVSLTYDDSTLEVISYDSTNNRR